MVHPDYAILIIALTGHVSIVYLTPLNLPSLCGYILSAMVQLKNQNLIANKMWTIIMCPTHNLVLV